MKILVLIQMIFIKELLAVKDPGLDNVIRQRSVTQGVSVRFQLTGRERRACPRLESLR